MSDTDGHARQKLHPPGYKRLLIASSVLFSLLLGVPVWWQLTKIHRFPLPFVAIDKHSLLTTSDPLLVPQHLQVVFLVSQGPGLKWMREYTPDSLKKIILPRLDEAASNNSRFSVSVIIDSGDKCLSSSHLPYADTGGSMIKEMMTCSGGAACKSSNVLSICRKTESWPCCLTEGGVEEAIQVLNADGFDNWLRDFSIHMGFSEVERHGLYRILVFVGNDKKMDSTLIEVDNIKAAKLKEDESGVSDSISPHSLHTEVHGSLSAIVGKYRNAWLETIDFSTEALQEKVIPLIADVATTYFSNGGQKEFGQGRGKGERIQNDETSQSLPLAADGSAILSFSLLNAYPDDDWIFDWDFAEVKRRFLDPIVEVLAPVAELSVESQVLYYTAKGAEAVWNSVTDVYEVAFSDWLFFVNANEWHLDSSIGATGRSKLLHFAVYVPGRSESPLHLRLSSGRLSPTNAFTSPGWGGVIIYNPHFCHQQESGAQKVNGYKHRLLSADDLEPAMRTIVAQIRTLFQLPGQYPSESNSEATILPSRETGFAEWEVDYLLRQRLVEDSNAATATLASLSKLVKSLPSMVIKHEIGAKVTSALKNAHEVRGMVGVGAYEPSAAAARRARAQAEDAFFDPSMMALLYFPLEHHLAVYTPFFVPVFLHVGLSFARELIRYVRERRRHQILVEKS